MLCQVLSPKRKRDREIGRKVDVKEVVWRASAVDPAVKLMGAITDSPPNCVLSAASILCTIHRGCASSDQGLVIRNIKVCLVEEKS